MLKINRERRTKIEKDSVLGLKNHRSTAVKCLNDLSRI